MKNIGIDIIENKRFDSFIDPRKYSRILSDKKRLVHENHEQVQKTEYQLAGLPPGSGYQSPGDSGYSFKYTDIMS